MIEPTTEIARRRTFAIISHPDAGKTTLTEHLLRAGGAIQLAGNVRAKGERRRTRSDWMGIERDRGISVVGSIIGSSCEGAGRETARRQACHMGREGRITGVREGGAPCSVATLRSHSTEGSADFARPRRHRNVSRGPGPARPTSLCKLGAVTGC